MGKWRRHPCRGTASRRQQGFSSGRQGEELLYSLLNKTTRDTWDSLWNYFFADTKVGVKAVQTVDIIVQKFNTQVENS